MRNLMHGLRRLFDRDAADREIADEVEHFLDEAASALMADGVPEKEARRRVRREMGSATAANEQVRSYGWENRVEAVAGDVRFGLRQLRRNPGLAVLSVATLALGIGATTAILGVAKPILFDALPYPDPDRVVAIGFRGDDGTPLDVTFGSFRELADRSRSFASLAVVRPWQPTLAGLAEPERLDGQRVSSDYFEVLGMAPVLGRAFQADEDRPGGPAVVIVSHAFWVDRLGADRAVLDRTILLEGQPHTVIGVMGPGFENVLSPATRVWAPLQYDAGLGDLDGREWGRHLRMVGRLGPGVDLALARRDANGIAAAPVAEFVRPPWSSLEEGFVLTPLKDEVTRVARPGLLAIMGAVGLVLLLSCVNLTNLLLGRGIRRRAEFAMRAALGVRRSRLIQQLVTESLLLAFLGGVLGIAVAAYGIRALVALAPPDLPRLDAVGADPAVFAVALAITAAVGVVAGLVPALRWTRGGHRPGLREGFDRSARGHRLARDVLIVGEVALTLVLLVGAGLLLRSVDRLLDTDPGFEPSRVVALEVQVAGGLPGGEGAVRRVFAELLEEVQEVPGVAAAALSSQIPLSGEANEYGVRPVGAEAGGEDEGPGAFRYAVRGDYFGAMGIELRTGRLPSASDHAGAGPVAVLSEGLSRRLFGERSPIGEWVHIGRPDLPPFEVIGVVADVRQATLASPRAEAVYLSPEHWYFEDRANWLVVRADGDVAELVPSLRASIGLAAPGHPIVRVTTMDGLVAGSAAERRFALSLFGAFAMAALVLAAIGLYGVLAGSVVERTRELGVRSALGATRGDLLVLVLRQGMLLAGIGVLLGLGASVAMGRSLASLLFEVSPVDPLTYAAVVALLAVIAVGACAVPARRAGRVDPVAVLRAD